VVLTVTKRLARSCAPDVHQRAERRAWGPKGPVQGSIPICASPYFCDQRTLPLRVCADRMAVLAARSCVRSPRLKTSHKAPPEGTSPCLNPPTRPPLRASLASPAPPRRGPAAVFPFACAVADSRVAIPLGIMTARSGNIQITAAHSIPHWSQETLPPASFPLTSVLGWDHSGPAHARTPDGALQGLCPGGTGFRHPQRTARPVPIPEPDPLPGEGFRGWRCFWKRRQRRQG
jgi:hypothetical protein